MSPRDPRSTRRYRQLRALFLAWVWATGQPCWICFHPDPDSPDHIIPVSWRTPGIDPLDPSLWKPSHHRPCPTCGQRCNNRRQAKAAQPVPLNTSRRCCIPCYTRDTAMPR